VDGHNRCAGDGERVGGIRLSWTYILFSFKGRVARRHYWTVILSAVLSIVAFVFFILALPDTISEPADIALGVGTIIYALLVVWSCYAVSVKRWHDQDMSGWWVLLNFIPGIGGAIELICNGFRGGTVGPNRFGDDPT
jgi:uncharacterized membrane protein YhaH (DUF805 family)